MRAISAVSRAIVFCLKNLGAWYPGIMDMDTIGTTRKNIVVVAENEEESPWEPYHVSQGFLPDDSTVTVFSLGQRPAGGFDDRLARMQVRLAEFEVDDRTALSFQFFGASKY